mgnify:CR=1 FL=1
MSSVKTAGRQALIDEADRALRKMSSQGTLFGHAVAQALGIRPSDLESLDIIQLHGSVTAGQLATATGLTRGAITGLVDRLEAAGFLVRKPDAEDRRKVNIELHPAAFSRVFPLYASLHARMQENWEGFSDRQIKVILEFATRSHRILAEETTALSGGAATPQDPR